MVTMGTKFGRIYCATRDIRILYFQLQFPQNFTNRNETYGIQRGTGVLQNRILKFYL